MSANAVPPVTWAVRSVEEAAEVLIRLLYGENCQGAVVPDGMLQTPNRLVKAWREMTAGYADDPKAILARDFDSEEYDQIIALSDVPFVSLCEHHLLPFSGQAGVAYLPGKKRIVGLSKLARVVECFARRFQVQERLTRQIADAIDECLQPRGVAVVVRATHSCMTARGIKKPGSVMTTSVLRGIFHDQAAARAEALALLGIGQVSG